MKYWIAVASKEHVQRGVQEQCAQVCHGKGGPLKRMKGGDWIIYYSPTLRFGKKEPCRAFTAIGKIENRKPYLFQMAPDFIPWRRDVVFVNCKEVMIEPLIDQLQFIKDKKRWGFPFRMGCFEICESDFTIIVKGMEV